MQSLVLSATSVLASCCTLTARANNGGSKSPADGAKETVANHVFTEAKTSVLLQTDINSNCCE